MPSAIARNPCTVEALVKVSASILPSRRALLADGGMVGQNSVL
jgi:hypothetical protein